jgi:hypothetical protein
MTSNVSWPILPPNRQAARRPAPPPLVHPFRIGETYANRQGKYEVVQLAPPKATIRYEDGTTMEADIAILARIWENLQLPEESTHPEPRQRTSRPSAQSRDSKSVSQFRGLADGDFKFSVTGTDWRARLGKVLSARLSEITGTPHRSFPVYNRPALYIAPEHQFNARLPERHAKFLFRLTTEGAEYGFNVERDSKQMDDTWDWGRFIAALRTPGPWTEQVEAAMRTRGLQAEAELSTWRTPDATQEPRAVGRWTASAKGLESFAEGSSKAAPSTWQDMAGSLSWVEPSLSCDFFVLGRIKKADAINLGERIVELAAQAYAALMPLYTVSAR